MKTKFEHEMSRARAMHDVEPARAEYWGGYMRGLRRAYHGEKFGTDEEHRQYMSMIGDETRGELGRGYVDGLNALK